MNPLQISNIVMNVTMISTFIGIFFFTYGKTIEENVVKGQSELVADYIAKDLSTFIDKPTAQKLASQLSPPDMTNADKQVELKNTELQRSAFNILILVAVGGLLFTIILAKYYTLNLQSILKTNLVILLFVGLTEYIFLTYIGQNFISLDPNFVPHDQIELKVAVAGAIKNLPSEKIPQVFTAVKDAIANAIDE